MQIPANDNDAAIGSVRRAVRESSAFTEMIEPPPTTIDFDDPKVYCACSNSGTSSIA